MLTLDARLCDLLRQGDAAVIVTGAGGWLGQATLDMLDGCFGEALASRVYAFGSSERMLTLRSGRALLCRPLSALAELPQRRYFIMHYAFLTKDKVGDMPLETFVSRNEAIAALVAQTAVRLKAAGLFVPSSGAVYRADRSMDDDLERNPYGVLKARDERRFLALGETHDIPVVVSRVFNLAGPFINKLDSYALGSILADIKCGGPIVLRADRPVERSYAHVGDVINLAFALLLKPSGALPAFDTAGEKVIEVGDLARRAAELLGVPDMAIERPAVTGSANRYVGDGAAMARLMAQHGLTARTLDEQIRDTARYLEVLF